MKAVVFHKPGVIRVDQVPDPEIEHAQDVILKVTRTAICGSDLHILNGVIPQSKPSVMGHEFMGTVEETGSDVTALSKGDRVVVPFPIACGICFFCQHGLPGHCENSNPEKYGPEGGLLDQKGGGLFGYTDLYGGYSGGQAEYVRVPFANVGPRKVPEDLQDEEVLFLTDILPTGYTAIEWSKMTGGETVAVFGCGPVGLMAQKVAWLKGAERVIGVDLQPYRLRAAERVAGSEIVNIQEEDAVERIRDMTDGRGADVCVDAVGVEADRSTLEKIGNLLHLQQGSISALTMAISAARRGGAVSVVGVYGLPYDKFPLGQIFDKGLSLYFGQAPVQKYIDELIGLVKSRKIRLDDIISHRLSIDEAPYAYQIFRDKEDQCVKVVLSP
ncbi:MAG TPA: zinc-dependent alcohol dehydrogenase [Chthoniobacterales bacterium]